MYRNTQMILNFIFDNVLYPIIRIISLIINYQRFLYLRTFYYRLYSIWISLNFKEAKHVIFSGTVRLLLGGECITIGEQTRFGCNCVITAWTHYGGVKHKPTITIGCGCNFGDQLHLTAINSIQIGSNCLTGRWVTITDNSHGTSTIEEMFLPPNNRPLYSKGSVSIGNNVWIGDKVTILPNVTIGDGAIIAANTVVTKDIPAYSVAYGSPIKIINKKNSLYEEATCNSVLPSTILSNKRK